MSCTLREWRLSDAKDLANALSNKNILNWEMNGLLTAKRKENGYRIFTHDDVQRLKVIRTLGCANYSLERFYDY